MKSLISLAYLRFMLLFPNPFKWFTNKISNVGKSVTDSVAKAAADSVSESIKSCLDPIFSCGKKFFIVILVLVLILIICKVMGNIHKTSSDAQHRKKMHKIQEQNAQNTVILNTIKKINSNDDRMDSF